MLTMGTHESSQQVVLCQLKSFRAYVRELSLARICFITAKHFMHLKTVFANKYGEFNKKEWDTKKKIYKIGKERVKNGQHFLNLLQKLTMSHCLCEDQV
jgi:hypothetical protein